MSTDIEALFKVRKMMLEQSVSDPNAIDEPTQQVECLFLSDSE